MYGVTGQLRRSSCSVPANIVEGSARQSKKDYLHFLYMARGSLSETRYFLHLSQRLDYGESHVLRELEAEAGDVARVLHGLIDSVEPEAGRFSKYVARASSLLALCLAGRQMISEV